MLPLDWHNCTQVRIRLCVLLEGRCLKIVCTCGEGWTIVANTLQLILETNTHATLYYGRNVLTI